MNGKKTAKDNMKFYQIILITIFINIYFFPITAHSDYHIVFIHIGEQLPTYVARAIKQARLFNKKCDIYLISSKNALQEFSNHCIAKISLIDYETLPLTQEHINFSNKTCLKNFWKVTSERYLILYDFIKAFDLKNVFHFENDVLIYINLETLIPIFEKNYQLALPFDHDNRAISSFVYIKEHSTLKPLIICFNDNVESGYNDMQIPPLLAHQNKNFIQQLPILMPNYGLNYTLKNATMEQPLQPENYSKDFHLLGCIFDAAAIGQYLGGVYLQHKWISSYGFINETSIFNPAHFSYIWKKDHEERFIPYIIFKDTEFPIANLHIHSKRLKKFTSDNPSIIQNQYIHIASEA